MSDDEYRYELVLPFVVTHSNGGPYDDAAFVAGFNAGTVDAQMAAGEHMVGRYFAADLVPQLELLAMNRGYRLDVSEDFADPDLRLVYLTRLPAQTKEAL